MRAQARIYVEILRGRQSLTRVIKRQKKKSSSRSSPRNTYNNRKTKQGALAVNDGLVLSRDQIERIWRSYDVEEAGKKQFNLKSILTEYPHINQALLLEVSTNEISNQITQNAPIDIVDPMTFEFPVTHVAVQAENKLNRMLSKVKSQENIPSTMRSQIKVLLMAELEIVIDLWLSIADEDLYKGVHDNEDYNIKLAALFRASQLLLVFEAEFIKELRKSVDYGEEDLELFIGAPHTINYQKIISAFYNLFTKKQTVMSAENLEKIQFQCAKLLKKMMKHIISRRMDSLNDDGSDNDRNQQQMDEKRGHFALSTPFQQTIFFYTSSLHNTSYTNAIENATMASNLLQEMELYFHDFYTVESPSTRDQQFLMSINPSKRAFNSVLICYANIAIKNNCTSSAMKTIEILNRMIKRRQAYGQKGNEQNDSEIFIAQPNLSSYKAVFGAFVNLDQIDSDACRTLRALISAMHEDENVEIDSSALNLIKECQVKHDIDI